MPVVSVIIPTYNHRDYVLATLASVFAQTYCDYEVIVVNDGSPDDTEAVLSTAIREGKIKYMSQPNAGQAAARNRGLAEAKGEFIAYLDDDDLWPPDKLQWQVDALSTNPNVVMALGQCEALIGARRELWRTTPPPDRNWHRVLLRGNPIISPGQVLIRRTDLIRLGGFNESIRGVDDWDLWIRLSDGADVFFSEKVALHYRMHQGNASRDIRNMLHNGLQVLRVHHRPLRDLSNWRAARVWLADTYGPRLLAGGFRWRAGWEVLVRIMLLSWSGQVARDTMKVLLPLSVSQRLRRNGTS